MNLPARMAWRYLFARKSTNVINVITMIAAFGVAIGAAALLIVLSVFNGFEDSILGMFNDLNPDVRITPRQGKVFAAPDSLLRQLERTPGVRTVSRTLEEFAYFQYDERQSPGRIKGVDYRYPEINRIDTLVREGRFDLLYPRAEFYGAVVGNRLRNELGIDVLNQFEPLTIYMARPRARGSSIFGTGVSPFKIRKAMPTGVVMSQESFENQTVLLDLDFAREVLSIEDSLLVSALEISLAPGFANRSTYDELSNVMGEGYEVRNRFQQENSIFKLMQLEKWIGFAIVCLMMILVSFNLIGALWMIVLEKRKDISVLLSMGMTGQDVRNLFIRVGLMLCSIGLGAGFVIAIVLYLIQTNYRVMSLPGFLNEAYPIAFRWYDFPVVALTVLIIGFVASLLPARRAAQIPAVITEE